MAIVEMQKMSLISLQRDKENIIEILQRIGNIEITSLDEAIKTEGYEGLMEIDCVSEKGKSLSGKRDNLEFALSFLTRFDGKKKGFLDGKNQIPSDEYKQYVDNMQDCLDVYEQCKKHNDDFSDLKNEQTRLHNMITMLKPWTSLELPLEDVSDTEKCRVILGNVTKVDEQEFMDRIKKDLRELGYVHVVSRDKEDIYLVIIFHREVEQEVLSLLKTYGWNQASFANFKGTAIENIECFKQRLHEIDKQKGQIEDKAKLLLKYKINLEAVYDYLSIEKERADIVNNFIKTDKAFMLEGWVPAAHIDSVREHISKFSNKVHMSFRKPEKGERFPVQTHNPKLVKPFELITDLYSTPAPRSLDPSIYMAPFYFMFFGIMLSDAGYGLVLALAVSLFIWKFNPKGAGKQLIMLIGLGGVSTFLWGAIFGLWFGVELRPLWFNPMEEPITMLILCFAIGLFQVFVGMGLQAYMSIRSGKVIDALLDQGLWYLLLTGLILLAVPAAAITGKYMSIIGVIGLILTQGRSKKGIFGKFISGIGSLYKLTGFLSDVLSYSRLFALGLATGVIAMVVNTMAKLFGPSIWGIILMIIIMIGGHSFNILINTLGAFVHASRLQYIEFFGKFFEGGGKAFTPFRINTKYTDVYKKPGKILAENKITS